MIAFAGDSFPLNYLNEKWFSLPIGDSQLVSREPLSIRWTGFVLSDGVRSRSVSIAARGAASLTVDGQKLLNLVSAREGVPVSSTISLSSGLHEIEIRYQKPARSEGPIEARLDEGRGPVVWGAPSVTPYAYAIWRIRLGALLVYPALAVHLRAAGPFVWFIVRLARASHVPAAFRPSVRRIADLPERHFYLALFFGFAVQGFLVTLQRVGRT